MLWVQLLFSQMILSPQVVFRTLRAWIQWCLRVRVCVYAYLAWGPALSADRCMWEGGAHSPGDMSGIAKSIMVNNAFILATFSLKYCEITYCLCAECLFSWTALALVKLLKVPELRHSWQGWLAGMGWWLLARHCRAWQEESFPRAPDLAGISEWIFVPPKFYRWIVATCSYLEVLRLSLWCSRVLTGGIDVSPVPRQLLQGDRMVW